MSPTETRILSGLATGDELSLSLTGTVSGEYVGKGVVGSLGSVGQVSFWFFDVQ